MSAFEKGFAIRLLDESGTYWVTQKGDDDQVIHYPVTHWLSRHLFDRRDEAETVAKTLNEKGWISVKIIPVTRRVRPASPAMLPSDFAKAIDGASVPAEAEDVLLSLLESLGYEEGVALYKRVRG